MQSTHLKIKICGITNLEDALMACEAGADALGFVFYEKSPRYIEFSVAKDIVKKLPPFVKIVGLFVNANSEDVNEVCQYVKVDIAQIHFDADDDFFESLEVPFLRVVRATCKEDIVKYSDNYCLVDAFVENFGGEGKRVALEWFDGVDCSKIILAGGLTSENLHELKSYNFYGVDVSSGVESSKGKKDKTKVKEFIANAKSL
ncbi:N-(5'-phosphoribosyl)anthranilate isomerase [Sulfurovum sp. enrichment culture clone C5]|uniref:N-(5'-phosphoribosyl)anthranilate isomerase n=1 Tax=Sulfurovum sp. enrichment culture clone C5 TaxID=497650 RepID=A0A0S4XPV9_9BACT|nr:N-(5'-phosphoribosyl)anthranilate isomerase [Sulfurovum sp. enrichment culture clone C5]